MYLFFSAEKPEKESEASERDDCRPPRGPIGHVNEGGRFHGHVFGVDMTSPAGPRFDYLSLVFANQTNQAIVVIYCGG